MRPCGVGAADRQGEARAQSTPEEETSHIRTSKSHHIISAPLDGN